MNETRYILYTARTICGNAKRNNVWRFYALLLAEGILFIFLKDECVYLTRTKDFVDFSEARMVIKRGGDEDQEWHIGTGSICRMGEKFYFYFTGFRNPETISSENHAQVIMRAVSEDLLNWEKDSSFLWCQIRNIVRMVIGETLMYFGMKK